MIPQCKRSFCFLFLMLLVAVPLTAFPSTTQYTYDSLNRITKVDYGDGYTEQYAFDAAGNRTSLMMQLETTPPVSTVTSPSNNVVVTQNSVTISGTATDSGGTGVQKVEVSVDGGNAWHTATGTTSWTYTAAFLSNGTYQVMVRATDNAGNVEPVGNQITVKVNIPGDGWTLVGDVPVYYLAYGNNAYVAGGTKSAAGVVTGKIFSSTDLDAWTETYDVLSPVTGNANVNVAYINNAFFAVPYVYDASSAVSTVKILTSSDGNAWSEKCTATLPGVGGGKIVYLNSTFVVPMSAYNSVTKTITVKIFVSADGNTWSEKYSAALPGMLQAASGASAVNVAYMKNVFLVYMAVYNATANSTAIKILSSVDGNNWTESYAGSLSGSGFMNPVIFEKNTFITSSYAYNSTAKSTVVKAVTSPDGSVWTEGNTWTLTGNGGGSVVFLNNTFVARVSAYDQTALTTTAKVFFSTDGSTWSEKYSTTLSGSGGTGGMAYGSGSFVFPVFAVNAGTNTTSMKIISSPDGNAWTETFSGTYQGSMSGRVAYINNMFFLYASMNDASANTTVKLLVSSEGNTWTENYSGEVKGYLQQIGVGISYPVNLIRLNNVYVLWFSTYTASKILLSSDGNTWTEKYSGNVTVTGVNSLNGNIIAYGYDSGMNGFIKILAASSGTPEQHTLTVTKTGPGAGVVASYPEGITCGAVCTYKYNADTVVTLTATPAADSTFIGWSGGVCSGTGACNVLMSSPRDVTAIFGLVDDPLDNLQTRLTLPDYTIFKVLYGNNTYVALALNTAGQTTQKIFVSQDGVTWIEKPLLNDSPNDPAASSLYYYGGMFIKISGYYNLSTQTSSSRLFSSPDGTSWTERTIPGASFFGAKFYYYNNTYYAFGNVGGFGKFYRSADLNTWTEVIVADNFNFAGLRYYNGIYYAVGQVNGNTTAKLFASTDGVQWTEKHAPAGVSFFNLFFYDNTYFAIGFDSQYNYKLFISTDLSVWTALTIETGFNPMGLAYYDNTFFLNGSKNNFGKLYTSFNGITWTSRTVGDSPNFIRQPSYFNNTFFVTNLDASNKQHLYTSYDGMTWTEKQTFTITNFLGINFLNDTYLVYGDYPDITTGKTTGVIMQSPRLDMNAYRTTLSSGWNFVSLPVQPDDKTISKMLQDISTNVRIVWGYNNKDKVWLKYKPSAISNTLDIIESGKGYWFYMNNPVTLTVTGKDASPAVALSNGWNLVGYGGQESTMNLPANYVIIWGWENGTWKAKAANTSAQLNVSPLDALNRGKAYWIKMSTDATWQQ